MFKSFFNSTLLVFILIIILASIFPFFSSYEINLSEEYYLQYDINFTTVSYSLFGFYWPLPSNHKISSHFGHRISPTTGASSYHQGIDIPANEDTYFLSIMDCEVIYTGFNGSGGYSIICVNDIYKISYCHVSPNFLVSVGDSLIAGQVIGQVGPKYVYDVIGNPYHDYTGKPTNGATTGCHLHITFKVYNRAVDPLDYINA